ncbi:MAG: hypothetical protein IAG13_12320, partial [Deltaproteobacteria bacterium]|nr:hypothetical protein [Nannocystaceae bacterium]
AGASARALVHIGSPALSWPFIAALEAELGGWGGWLDVDGYLFEALTHDDAAWELELARDEGLRALVRERPDFRARVAAVRSRIEDLRGAPLAIAVVDFGAGAWWGDMGQLSRAREAYAALVGRGETGELARRLAGIAEVVPDRCGNRVVGRSKVPVDGSVTDSVLVDAMISGGSVAGAVVIRSQLGEAKLASGAVVVESTVVDLVAEAHALVMMAIAEHLHARTETVHTTILADPQDLHGPLDPWWFDTRLDPGTAEHYRQPFADNPCSFAEKATQMRQRTLAPTEIETALHRRRLSLREKLTAAVDE